LIVVALMGILAGIMLPNMSPSIHDQLRAAAEVVAADLMYARDLAVTNNSSYELTFDAAAEHYVLRHSGANSLLDDLPKSPFHVDDPSDAHTTRLKELPHVGPSVEIVKVYAASGALTNVTTLEFGPLGETSRAEQTVLWLACGGGQSRCYVALSIDPVTGLPDVGTVQASSPPASAAAVPSTP
jgi:type II secretory pathway pseudopilin PulG